MSFNSILFIFGFLPFALIGYYGLALTRLHMLRLPFLIVATLLFYARGSVQFLPLLLGSVTANYIAGLLVVGLAPPWNRVALWVGVCANVAALVWFKYANFLADSLSAAFGLDIALAHIALPLAISFYTFQQIAHLVDLSRGRIQTPRVVDYFAFILFFPQLLAGPISLSREMIPQIRERPVAAGVPANLLVGLIIFGIGLFKKTVIADSFALWTDPMFKAAAGGSTPGMAMAWVAPSPIRCRSISTSPAIPTWRSASAGCSASCCDQFPFAAARAQHPGSLAPLAHHAWPLRAELYLPAHGRAAHSLRAQPQYGAGRDTHCFHAAADLPRHGDPRRVARRELDLRAVRRDAGRLHDGERDLEFLHALQIQGEGQGAAPRRFSLPWGVPLTVFCFAMASVPFRAADLPTTWRIFGAMLGQTGPDPWNAWPILTPLGPWGLYPLMALGYLIAFTMPNTQQIMSRAIPTLEWPRWKKMETPPIAFEWRPAALPTFLAGAVFLIGLVFVARGSTQFIYFGF